jgi:hypothetical protein
MERLRMALPTIHNWEMAASCGGSGMPKPSKAAVLAGAVAYIQDIERERDYLRRENELLRSGTAMRRQHEWQSKIRSLISMAMKNCTFWGSLEDPRNGLDERKVV